MIKCWFSVPGYLWLIKLVIYKLRKCNNTVMVWTCSQTLAYPELITQSTQREKFFPSTQIRDRADFLSSEGQTLQRTVFHNYSFHWDRNSSVPTSLSDEKQGAGSTVLQQKWAFNGWNIPATPINHLWWGGKKTLQWLYKNIFSSILGYRKPIQTSSFLTECQWHIPNKT